MERCGHIPGPSWQLSSSEMDQQELLRLGKPEQGLMESLGHVSKTLACGWSSGPQSPTLTQILKQNRTHGFYFSFCN